MLKRCVNLKVGGFVTVLVLITSFWAGPVFATGNASASKCNALGKIDVKCYTCPSGEYLGIVSMTPVYDAAGNDCISSFREIKDRCANAYQVPKDEVGFKYKYWLDLTILDNKYPDNCNF